MLYEVIVSLSVTKKKKDNTFLQSIIFFRVFKIVSGIAFCMLERSERSAYVQTCYRICHSISLLRVNSVLEIYHLSVANLNT